MIASTPALFNALTSIHVLAGTDLPAQTLLAQEGIVHNFLPNTWIVREGEEGHSLFVIVEGDVQVVKHADSAHAIVLATLHEGDLFGEMCVVDPVPRAASVRSMTPVKSIEIKASTLHHLYQKLPDQYSVVLLNLARDMARRLRQIDEAFCARSS